jgi:uncharacterized protein
MRQSKASTHLDPRDPLVIDTRELGRRPGSMRRVQRTVPAPPGLRLELVDVPEGSEVELDLRIEAVMEGVLVSGTARASASGECGRCLESVTIPLEAELVELYAYPGHEHDQGHDAPDEEDVGRLEGDFIPLEPRLRDAVLLALPLRPVCKEDCQGLCATCGVRLADVPSGHGHEEVDPRWSTLQELSGRLASSSSTEMADEER